MKLGYFGGTFDPVHRGHLAVARAAAERCGLTQVLFVPTDAPPHKSRQPLSEFAHRYAMVALALREFGDSRFVPSLLESPHGAEKPRYSVETIRRLRRELAKRDRIFFIIGMDAFAEIAKWREPEALLRECEFAVVSRPGFPLAEIVDALPERMRAQARISRGKLTAGGVTIHLVDNVEIPISATELRAALAARQLDFARLNLFLPTAVAEYICKTRLYGKPKQR